MSANKTQVTEQAPADFIDEVEPDTTTASDEEE